MAGRRRASAGRARRSRSRDDDYDDYEDERPRRGRSPANQGPNLPLIIGSVVGLVALLIIGYTVMTSTEKAREREFQEKKRQARRDKEAAEEKALAAEEKARQLAAEKAKRTGPWAKALEKVVMPLKKYMEKDNKVKRIIGSRGWENDRAEFHFKIRPKFYTEPMQDVRDTLDALCAKAVECAENGFAHAEKEGYPLAADQKVIIMHFWDPPTDPDSKEKGKEVATYRNGSLSITGR